MRKTLLTTAAVIGLASCLPVRAADAVEPASATITNARTDKVSVIPGSFYQGTTLVLTNNRALMSGGATQGLDGVTIDVNVGSVSSSSHYTGTVISAAAGTWWVRITVPTNEVLPLLQVKLTDAATNVFIYPLRQLSAQAPL